METKAFQYIKAHRKFFNISAIEESCGITRTSLLNAINRNQKSFGDAAKLVSFLDKNFKGWNK